MQGECIIFGGCGLRHVIKEFERTFLRRVVGRPSLDTLHQEKTIPDAGFFAGSFQVV